MRNSKEGERESGEIHKQEQRDSLAVRCANSLGTPDFRKIRINAEESQRTFEVTGVFEEYLPGP